MTITGSGRRLPRNAQFRHPSLYFLKGLRKDISGAKVLERFARWSETKLLLACFKTNGLEPESGALASAGVRFPIEAGNLSEQ